MWQQNPHTENTQLRAHTDYIEWAVVWSSVAHIRSQTDKSFSLLSDRLSIVWGTTLGGPAATLLLCTALGCFFFFLHSFSRESPNLIVANLVVSNFYAETLFCTLLHT